MSGAKEFQDDLVHMMNTIRAMSAKHGLAYPTLIFPREWRSPIKQMPMSAEQNLRLDLNVGERIMGVPFKFGYITDGEVLLP